jgi:hypothetical protein
MNNVAEKVTITMSDGTTVESDDFVVVINGEVLSDTQMMYNCNAILLGQAVQMTANAYHRDLSTLNAEEREMVQSTLQAFLDGHAKEA